MIDPIQDQLAAALRGELWSLIRRVLEQGTAIEQDNFAGRFPSYEHLSIRLDAAARERIDEFMALFSAYDAAQGRASDASAWAGEGWRPIETAPKEENLDFLAFSDGILDVTWVGWYDNSKPVYVHNDWVSWEPTHWMPLPAAPSQPHGKEEK